MPIVCEAYGGAAQLPGSESGKLLKGTWKQRWRISADDRLTNHQDDRGVCCIRLTRLQQLR